MSEKLKASESRDLYLLAEQLGLAAAIEQCQDMQQQRKQGQLTHARPAAAVAGSSGLVPPAEGVGCFFRVVLTGLTISAEEALFLSTQYRGKIFDDCLTLAKGRDKCSVWFCFDLFLCNCNAIIITYCKYNATN
jgi:hypothetical protein